MCGIVGALSKTDVVDILITGLKQLEYRGYDSAGIAIINDNNQLERIRTLGKIRELEKRVIELKLHGHIGIAHTRWATHGVPSEKNAHPHLAGDRIAIVHNGIIENHQDLRRYLLKEGCKIESDTDSELIAHHIYLKLQSGLSLLEAMRHTEKQLVGSFAIGLIDNHNPGHLMAMRRGSPLVVGLKLDEYLIASDAAALLSVTNQFIYLEDGDIADIQLSKMTVYDVHQHAINRQKVVQEPSLDLTGKGKYQHYMIKEIAEQPPMIAQLLADHMVDEKILGQSFGEKIPEVFSRIKHIQIVACGTSYYAGMVAKYWFEELMHIPVHVDMASEYRYRYPIIEENTLFLTLSQSGETADTLAALRFAKQSLRATTMTICNVANSTLVREADFAIMTNAGPEICVASTKSFTAQLVVLLLLALTFTDHVQEKNHKKNSQIIKDLLHLPQVLQQILDSDMIIKVIASEIQHVQNALFIGRGLMYPIALEGALKLKEISYMHAEAYAAGELKHGPLALVNDTLPVIVLAPNNDLLEKLKSNIEEILSRNGRLIVFTSEEAQIEDKPGIKKIMLPTTNSFLTPFIYAISMQLLAYYVALDRGTDIDQPRHLAKSVTVE